ncbi:hypothetical protein PZA11_003167 [Diplocarpon coronariae]|uniref:Early meiotic induction protein n=1 Tax=Diplocarpon coronariae TaxID=2795749 RepID=A0A218ZHI0_9HELO|nr:hypothetical protein B2J93_1987 [Marssonina coronariae]
MGWLWSTPNPSSPQQSGSKMPSQSNTQPDPLPSDTSSAKPLSRDDLAEQELNSFLKELQADAQPSRTKYQRVPRDASSNRLPSPSPLNADTDSTNEPLNEQILPTSMSCRSAFDQAFYCNSFGGRWNDLYRYGTLRSCSDDWNDFWFCMRTRTYPEKEKQKAIKEHYRQRESAKYAKALGRESSEDVWRSRERKMEWGKAFTTPFPKFEGTDEEWRKRELEWRSGKVDESVGG